MLLALLPPPAGNPSHCLTLTTSPSRLGRLLSKGLQARASSEEGALAAAAAALNAPGGPVCNPPSNPNSLPLPPLPPLASLRATRSSRRSADLPGIAGAGAPTSLTLSSGSGGGSGSSGPGSLDMPRRGSGGRSRHMAALKSQNSPGSSTAQATRCGGPATTAPAADAAALAAAVASVPADAAFADVLLAPTFTSQEIQMLMEALGAKN